MADSAFNDQSHIMSIDDDQTRTGRSYFSLIVSIAQERAGRARGSEVLQCCSVPQELVELRLRANVCQMSIGNEEKSF
jgi:hypothetical protein